ncbi:MAG: hypothetical protein AAGI07_04460 [Bacteroidota bacterium]
MSLATLIISCLLLYSTSKYFPSNSPLRFEKSRKEIIIISIFLLFISFWALTNHYDAITSVVIWLAALMTILSSVILTIKLNIKWLYVWGSLCVLSLIIDSM